MTITHAYRNGRKVIYKVNRTYKNKKGKLFADCDKIADGIKSRIDGIDLDSLMKSRFIEKS